MAEETLSDSFPDLKELESKVGRKTPESLLVWMRDAADCEDSWGSDVVDQGDRGSPCKDSFSDKISNLKHEMRCLRSTDVRILRQLVAVHEGIEALRWLMEERDVCVSRGSSLTGSVSSLGTVEEQGCSSSPCRGRLSPTQDLTEISGEESENHQTHAEHGDPNHQSSYDTLRPECTAATPPCSSTSKSEVSQSSGGRRGQAPWEDLVSATQKDSAVTPLQGIKAGAESIRRALLRSNRFRREVKVDAGAGSALAKQSGQTQTEQQTQATLRDSQSKTTEEDGSPCGRETVLLGYDAQWCWVESQDDVTFL